MLANRLRKRFKHLKKWANRNDISCFRIYEKDIPEFPLIVDWYDGDVVAWIKKRKRDVTQEHEQEFVELCRREILEAFQIEEKNLFIKERRRQRKEGERSQYEKIARETFIKKVSEQGLNFEVNLSDYLDTGLFLDHRIARHKIRELSKGKSFLNLFAYTGSFSVYAMDGGAKKITTVDMSHTYLNWAKRNLELNEFDHCSDIDFIASDCLKWLKQAYRCGLTYDLVVCDPPTFSNSKRMNESSFCIDRDYVWLLLDIHKILNPNGLVMFSNNSRNFDFDTQRLSKYSSIEEWSHKSVSEDFRNTKIHRSWWLRK